jgi:FkbH-like protein
MFDPIDLSWLPEAPSNFRAEVKAVGLSPAALNGKLRALSAHRLNNVQCRLFNRALATLQSTGPSVDTLQPFRLTVLSNATVDLVCDALPVAAARHGVALQVHMPPFDQVLQQALDPCSDLCSAKSDAVLLLLDHRWLGLATAVPAKSDRVANAVEMLVQVLDAMALNGVGPAILQTISMPPLPLFGSYDRFVEGSARDVDLLNQQILQIAKQRGHYVIDVAALCETIGTARYHDPVAWNLYKLPMSQAAVPLFADWLGRLISAIRGKSRKCLVLDLDNTLWGGVIGDDGLSGIKIGQGSAEGEAFLSVQQYALDLKRRGIILAVSSKNEDLTARSAFSSHPDMLLREHDIAVFQANWTDKASNIEAIASSLNIGLDSLVFLDDNGAERAQVRAALPEVAVPEVGNDAAHYATILASAGYFEATAFSEEDKSRASTYQSNARREEVRATARNLGDYLSSLEMTISHGVFDSISSARIAQLINKSNQFNLTTQRYTQAEVLEAADSPNHFTQQSRLADRFGDFGMIGVIIAAKESEFWNIDTWLMSCRVLGRDVESSMLDHLVSNAKRHGVIAINASFIPTAKNMMVSDHFDKLGFTRIGEEEGGIVRYQLEVSGYQARKLPFGQVH